MILPQPDRHTAEELRCRRLVEPALRPRQSHDLEQSEDTHGVDARRVLRFVERDADMALARKVVDLVRLHANDHRLQAERVDQVAIMEFERQPPLDRNTAEPVDPLTVEIA